ncbi:hypothetical protein BCY90_16530 [Agrobacterium deltaense]|nr:hypothetical protein BCY90_16530 [Agrobacterium deltaense]
MDLIAAMAKVNKRMIYEYFGNKDTLFERVVSDAQLASAAAEEGMGLDHMSPLNALETFAERKWNFCQTHPEEVAILYGGRDKQESYRPALDASQSARSALSLEFRNMVERGVSLGVFRNELDPVYLHLTISSLAYCLSNNFFQILVVPSLCSIPTRDMQMRFELYLQMIAGCAHKQLVKDNAD